VYVVSHDRRMSEIVAPTRKDLMAEFARGSEGMTIAPVPLEQLEAALRKEMTRLLAQVLGV
jgi:hypothetical protein